MLNQVYQFDNDVLLDNENGLLMAKKRKKRKNKTKKITFRKNEIFFMGRKSVIINLRDISQEQSHYKVTQSSNMLKLFESTLSEDLVRPIESIKYLCSLMLKYENLSRKQLIQNYRSIMNATKFAQLKVYNLVYMN